MDPRIDNPDWCAERLEAGDTVAAIAQAAGVSRQTASSWIKRHGLQANHRALVRPSPEQMAADYRRKETIRALAFEYGISPAVMRTWLVEADIELRPPGRRSVNFSKAHVRARRARGESWQAIADDIGINVKTLRREFPD